MRHGKTLARALPAVVMLALAAAAGAATVRNTEATTEGRRLFFDVDLNFDTTGEAELGQVVDLDVGPDGRVFVLDRGFRHVAVFDSTGGFLAVIGDEGQGPGLFSEPAALAAAPDGRLLVADRGRIQTFSPAGTIESFITRPLLNSFSHDLCLADDGTLYECTFDMTSHLLIHHYSPHGELLGSFGENWAAGRDVDPRAERSFASGGLDLRPDGTLVFSQLVPYEIRLYGPDGSLLTTVQRENDFIGEPEFEASGNHFSVRMMSGSGSVFALPDGGFLNQSWGRDDQGESWVVLDLYDTAGRLHASGRLTERFWILGADPRGHFYALTNEELPTLVRCRMRVE